MAARSRVRWRQTNDYVISSRPSGSPWDDVVTGQRRDFVEAETGLERAFRLFGKPWVPDAASAEDEALQLLAVAAEIEQSLMVQYLYAALSVDDAEDTGADVRLMLTTIAVEEMGHLWAVQNLRIALGATAWLGRQDQQPDDDADPYPFRLQPLSRACLARFVAAEAPDPATLASEAEKLELDEIGKEAGAAGVPVHRVGLIYMRLFYLFQDDDSPTETWPAASAAKDWSPRQRHHIDKKKFAADPHASMQGPAGEWQLRATQADMKYGVVTDTEMARKLLFHVSAQGEGPKAADNSHFKRFRDLYRQAKTSAVLPFKVFSLPDSKTDVVDAEPAASLSRLIDFRYELLLLTLQQATTLPGQSAARSQRLDWAFREMRDGIGGLSRILMSLPRNPGGSPATEPAGPLYSMPSYALPTDGAALSRRMQIVMQLSKCLSGALPVIPGAKYLLEEIAKLDKERSSAG